MANKLKYLSDNLFSLHNLLLIYLTVSIVAICSTFLSINFTDDSPFVVGAATAYGVDIAARIRLVYYLIFIGICVAIALNWVFRKHLNNYFNLIDSKLLRWLLLLLLIICVVNLPKWNNSTSYYLLNIGLIFLLLPTKFFKNKHLSFPSKEELTIVFCSLASMYGIFQNWIVVILLGLILGIIIKYFKNTNGLTAATILLSVLPISIVIGIELTLILNQRAIYLPSYFILIAFSFLLLIALTYIWKIPKMDAEKRLYNFHFPLLIFSLALFKLYAPVLVWNSEMFELANNLNPLMLSSVYGKSPMLDFVPSHLFSDFIPGYFYAFLNGYNGSQDPLIYKNIPVVFSFIIAYYFLKSITGNRLLLGTIFILCPFLTLFFPESFAFALLPIMSFHQFFRTEKKKYLWYTFSLLFLVALWRVDLGVGLISSFALVIVLWFYENKAIRKSLIIIGSSFSILGAVLLFSMNSLREGLLKQLAHYFGANQAHGLQVLSYTDSNWFYIDYIIVPFLIGMIVVFLLLKRKQLLENKFYFPFLLLIGFYFFNIQRGLVRHSFAELNETYILSFGWLIIFIFVYHFIEFKKAIPTYAYIICIGYFGSLGLAKEWKPMLDLDKYMKLSQLPSLSNGKVVRTLNAGENAQGEIIAFLNSNLEKDETFLDFTNTPMLYYYTQKNVPSIFCQYLQNTIDGFLQDENLKLLNKTKIPLVLFNHEPRTFFDVSDGIPNEVRYYRITAHIYKNYHPYKQVNGYNIWIQNSSKLSSELDLSQEEDQWFLGQIPGRWKLEKEQKGFVKKRNLKVKDNSFELRNVKADDFLRLEINAKQDEGAILYFLANGNQKIELNITLLKGKHTYSLPIGCSYQAITNKELLVTSSLSNESKIISAEIAQLH